MHGARPIISVAAFVGVSVLTHGLVAPHIGFMPDAVVSDTIGAVAASGASFAGFRRASTEQQLYGLRQALVEHWEHEPIPGAAANPGVLHRGKVEIAAAVPAAMVAKYWIVIGKPPDDESLTAILERLQRIERRQYRDDPCLTPEVALRIAVALTDIPPQDCRMLSSKPVVSDWESRRATLEQRMIDAHFHDVLLVEKGDRGVRRAARIHDVPSQSEVATYFILTGDVPPETMRGVDVHRALRRMQRHRAAHIDPLAAKHAVFSLLEISAGHPALLPAHRESLPKVAGFPSEFSHEDSAAAEMRYKAAINLPTAVVDSFVGRDGWHYVRILGHGRRGESIVATRTDQTSTLIGRVSHIDRMWGRLKAERSAKSMELSGETEMWTHVLRAQLVTMHRIANAMKDSPQMVWPPHGPTDPWAAARKQLDDWVKKQLPALPPASVPHRVARHGPGPLARRVSPLVA